MKEKKKKDSKRSWIKSPKNQKFLGEPRSKMKEVGKCHFNGKEQRINQDRYKRTSEINKKKNHDDHSFETKTLCHK